MDTNQKDSIKNKPPVAQAKGGNPLDSPIALNPKRVADAKASGAAGCTFRRRYKYRRVDKDSVLLKGAPNRAAVFYTFDDMAKKSAFILRLHGASAFEWYQVSKEQKEALENLTTNEALKLDYRIRGEKIPGLQ